MSLYYFNIRNDDDTGDYEGEDLPDDAAARAYAVAAARNLAAETVSLGHFAGCHRLEIVNEARELVDTVTFGEAVEIRR